MPKKSQINEYSDNSIKKPTHGYQNCHVSQISIFGGYVKMRETLNTQVIIWVNTILNHMDTRVILPKMFLHGT
jgi:hypothetical protein